MEKTFEEGSVRGEKGYVVLARNVADCSKDACEIRK